MEKYFYRKNFDTVKTIALATMSEVSFPSGLPSIEFHSHTQSYIEKRYYCGKRKLSSSLLHSKETEKTHKKQSTTRNKGKKRLKLFQFDGLEVL